MLTSTETELEQQLASLSFPDLDSGGLGTTTELSTDLSTHLSEATFSSDDCDQSVTGSTTGSSAAASDLVTAFPRPGAQRGASLEQARRALRAHYRRLSTAAAPRPRPRPPALQLPPVRCDGPCGQLVGQNRLELFGQCEHACCMDCVRTQPRLGMPHAEDFGCPHRHCLFSNLFALASTEPEKRALLQLALVSSQPRPDQQADDCTEIRLISVQLMALKPGGGGPNELRVECRSDSSVQEVLDEYLPDVLPTLTPRLRLFFLPGNFDRLPPIDHWLSLSQVGLESKRLPDIADDLDNLCLIAEVVPKRD